MASETSVITNENCCRTCLKEDSLMFDLFTERLESSNIADMLIACTKLKINKDDSLPRQICRYCYNCLISFSHFRNMAQKAEDKLRHIMLSINGLNHFNTEGDFYEIKIENNDNDNLFQSQIEEKFTDCLLDENKNSESHYSNVLQPNNCKEDVKLIKKELYCVQCNKTFSQSTKLKHNELKHFHLDQNTCNLCTESNDNENISFSAINKGNQDLNLIIDSNTEADLSCIICSSRFKSMNLLSAHLSRHLEKGQVVFCKDCGKKFKKLSHLKRHKASQDCCSQRIPLITKSILNEAVNTSICEPNDPSLDQGLQCSECSLKFKNVNSLSAHMRKHTEKGRVISCRICNKVFKKLSHLKRHEVQHEVNCPYKCSLCPKSFTTEDILKDHVNKHKGVKPHGCPVCGKKFSHLSTLTTHIKIHTRDKAYLCPTCGKKFDSSTNLNQHMLRHIGLKKYACTLCPKRFVSKGELKSHTVTHTGERSYTCDQCGATFTKRSSLTKHKIRHLGLKPHQCDTCSMRFTSKDHLKRHYRIHTGEKPYKCDMCDRAFTQSNDLVKHRRAHVGDKVYKCLQCDEGFRLHTELRQHISEHFITSQMEATNISNVPKDGVSSTGSIANMLHLQSVGTDGASVAGLQTNNSADIKS